MHDNISWKTLHHIVTVSDVSNEPDSGLQFPAETSNFILAAGSDTFWGPLAILCLVGASDTIGAL